MLVHFLKLYIIMAYAYLLCDSFRNRGTINFLQKRFIEAVSFKVHNVQYLFHDMTSLQCYGAPSTIAQVLRKMSSKILAS